jgi:2-iminobutanoate/2-iminopropanoate deaminase
MAEKIVVSSERAGTPGGHYSQAIRFGQLVFTAGTVGQDPETGEIVSGGIRAQVRQALENVSAILEEAGSSMNKALKVNAYLGDMADFAAFNQIYAEYLSSGSPPARTTVGVSFAGEIAFEIDVIAYVPE